MRQAVELFLWPICGVAVCAVLLVVVSVAAVFLMGEHSFAALLGWVYPLGAFLAFVAWGSPVLLGLVLGWLPLIRRFPKLERTRWMHLVFLGAGCGFAAFVRFSEDLAGIRLLLPLAAVWLPLSLPRLLWTRFEPGCFSDHAA